MRLENKTEMFSSTYQSLTLGPRQRSIAEEGPRRYPVARRDAWPAPAVLQSSVKLREALHAERRNRHSRRGAFRSLRDRGSCGAGNRDSAIC